MFRSVLRVAPAAMRPAVRRVVTRVFAAGAITSATVATTGTTTSSGGSSVAASNTRSRGVAHVSSSDSSAAAPVAAKKKAHWSADEEGINAQQRALAKVQSTDPVERLKSATTRELLQAAVTSPGVVAATLQAEVAATAVPASSTVLEETAFLAKMESEFGRDVLQVLRRQQWAVNIANTNQVATLVCYFQEGTQRILYRRLTA